MNSGVHYWEIKVDKISENDGIMLGIAVKGSESSRKLFESGKFWGWMCAGGQALYPDLLNHGKVTVKSYGRDTIKQGDTVGIIFEFKNGKGHLTYLKNGNSLGICFKDIPAGNYLPAAILYYGEV